MNLNLTRQEVMQAELARLVEAGADEPFINGFKRAMQMMGEAGSVRPVVERFALAMERKLRLNDGKGGWQSESFDYLLERLDEEIEELKKTVHPGRNLVPQKVLKEAADVANYVMMVADVAGALDPDQGG